MYKVTKPHRDGLTHELRAVGDIIDVTPERAVALGKFIKPIKEKIEREPETEMIDSGITEKAILRKPKNKGRKNH